MCLRGDNLCLGQELCWADWFRDLFADFLGCPPSPPESSPTQSSEASRTSSKPNFCFHSVIYNEALTILILVSADPSWRLKIFSRAFTAALRRPSWLQVVLFSRLNPKRQKLRALRFLHYPCRGWLLCLSLVWSSFYFNSIFHTAPLDFFFLELASPLHVRPSGRCHPHSGDCRCFFLQF